MEKIRKDKVKGCGEYLYSNGDYHQTCDGWALVDGSYRLCKKCKAKPLVRLTMK